MVEDRIFCEMSFVDQKKIEDFTLPLSGGFGLPSDIRTELESFFGIDFGNVRLHICSHPSLIDARAIACKEDIYFAPGHFDTKTREGRWLLAHELTHVVQYLEGRLPDVVTSVFLFHIDDRLEAEADEMGALFANDLPSGRAASVGVSNDSAHLGGGFLLQANRSRSSSSSSSSSSYSSSDSSEYSSDDDEDELPSPPKSPRTAGPPQRYVFAGLMTEQERVMSRKMPHPYGDRARQWMVDRNYFILRPCGLNYNHVGLGKFKFQIEYEKPNPQTGKTFSSLVQQDRDYVRMKLVEFASWRLMKRMMGHEDRPKVVVKGINTLGYNNVMQELFKGAFPDRLKDGWDDVYRMITG